VQSRIGFPSSRVSVRVLVVTLVALTTVALALAQVASPLRLELQRFLVVEQAENGESTEEFVPALQLQPGDVMLESLTALNVSDSTLGGIALVVPVANDTAYIDGSASLPLVAGAPVVPTFSFDNGLTFALPPLKRTIVVIENGVRTEREVDVAANEYTHVRWEITTLAPQDEVVVSFRAVVE
jgi:hypothetical protein